MAAERKDFWFFIFHSQLWRLTVETAWHGLQGLVWTAFLPADGSGSRICER